MAANKENWIELMIERQAIPMVLREETTEAFCAKHGVPVANYYYHASKKENSEKIIELSLNVAKRAVPDILDKLVEKAKEGDMKAIDTYLDSVAKLAKHFDITTQGKPINILHGVLSNDSNKKDNEDDQEA